MNDTSICLLIFADDAVLFAYTPTAGQNTECQSLLDDLHTNCDSWDLKENTNKTKIM